MSVSVRLLMLVGLLSMVRSLELRQASAPVTSCPFGYGCGGGGSISPATRDEVAHILGGILSKLSNKQGLVQKSGVVHEAVVTDVPQRGSPPTKEARDSLSKFVGLLRLDARQATAAGVIAGMLAADMPDYGCRYFGACGDANSAEKPISSQTKAEVANILEGILANLSKHK